MIGFYFYSVITYLMHNYTLCVTWKSIFIIDDIDWFYQWHFDQDTQYKRFFNCLEYMGYVACHPLSRVCLVENIFNFVKYR